jgi:hypothetical protein
VDSALCGERHGQITGERVIEQRFGCGETNIRIFGISHFRRLSVREPRLTSKAFQDADIFKHVWAPHRQAAGVTNSKVWHQPKNKNPAVACRVSNSTNQLRRSAFD